MDAYRDALARALTKDVKHVYEKGLDLAIEATLIPALAELAKALHSSTHDCGQVVKAVLCDAIDRVAGKEHRNPKKDRSPEMRREGFKELLGIGEYPGGDLTRRQDDAADMLGYSSGDSLRQSKQDGRNVRELLIEELVGHLLDIAEEHRFGYSALRTWSTFYPDRPVYDYNHPHWEHGRYGAVERRPVFNSFINVPEYGDERTFFDGRRGDQLNSERWDPVTDVTQGDQTVILRIFVDNMAYVFTDDPYSSTAYGTRVRIHLPTATGMVLRARGYIWADNAARVEDTVDLIGSEPFRVEYMPRSAVLLRGPRNYSLDDSIVGKAGALIGHSVMDGVLPAGNKFEYAALVKITVRVITSEAIA
jgi:hypothetical protein